MNVLAFDIETVPDVALGRRLHDTPQLDDDAVAEMMFTLRRAKTGTDFLPLEQHRVVAISAALYRGGRFRVWSLGEPDAPEAEILRRFFEGIERFTPTLVSWNGSGFDLPVLHYRSLLAGVSAPRYWETGDEDSSFRWNNYLSRFHQRHTDLMDVLSGYQPRASVPLDRLATACGFPGKLGMSGAAVWPAYRRGEIQAIRAYCETDVVNTFLLYLRHQRMRGQLDEREYQAACAHIREVLAAESGEHWSRFLAAWTNDDGLESHAAQD